MAPVNWLSSIKSLYHKESPKPPAISVTTAALLSVGYTLLYVIPFYLSNATRPSPSLSRDSPAVIRARIRAVSLSCLLGAIPAIYILSRVDHETPTEALHVLGWWPMELLAVAKTLLLCSILFIGPLFEGGIVQGKLGPWLRGAYLRETFSEWVGWRNFVAGPVTEELVFRSFIIPLHLLAHMPPTRIVFITPLYFGIAHIHHCYEFVLTHPKAPMTQAVLRSVFQFTYTSLFGFFAAFVYLRTGSVFAPIAAHVFCNWMGLPKLWGRIRVEAGEPIGPPQPKRDDEEPSQADEPAKIVKQKDLSGLWTIMYYSLLVGGAFGFWRQLWPLTETETALAYFK